MKKNQVNSILANQTKRRNMVFAAIVVIIIVSLLALSFFLIYFNSNKEQYVSYQETSDVDYNVFLKGNDFFENKFLGKNNGYIASLIDYIDADFKYNLFLGKENAKYKYSYRIENIVEVIEKNTKKSLYKKTEQLLQEDEKTTSLKELAIDEKVNIDYNYYNNLMKKFVSIYSLEEIESTLTINMYVNILGSCEDLKDNKEKESVISLSIPLTTKTVAIDISNNLMNNDDNIIKCEDVSSTNLFFLFLGIIFVIGDLCLIIYTIKYEIDTRTAENIYERELKKILNNYGSYIQTLNADFDFKNYQLLKIETFTDMLEIRDTIRQPILMRENKEKTGAYFVIPGSSKILYVYRLKVCDIKNIKKGIHKLC